MSEILTLSHSMGTCPTCWKNFINMVSSKYPNGERDIPVDVIDQELSPYSGFYFEQTLATPCVIFDSEKYKSFFMLKFG